MSDKIYVGNGKKHDQYDLINFSVCLTDLPKEHIFEHNGKKYIKLTIAEKQNAPDKYGKTHYVIVDTWKPTQQNEPEIPSDDLPF